MTYIVTLPLPPVECSPNGRFHWAAKAKSVKQYREDCYWVLKVAKIPPMERVTVSLTFDMARGKVPDGRYRPTDTDNALSSIKGCLDSMQDAGIVRSDDHHTVKHGAIVLNRTKKEHDGRCGLTITIEEV